MPKRRPTCSEVTCGASLTKDGDCTNRCGTRHECHVGRIRVDDTIIRADGTRSVVTDVQHYLTAFIGRTADIWGTGGFKVNGAVISAEITVIAGPNHPDHL